MSDYGTIDLSGAIVTASGVAACRPRALTVYGSSTQSGTPTPSAPVAIQSVAGQLYQQTVYAAEATYTTAGVAVTHNADGTCTVSGTATGNAWLWGGGSSAVAGYYVTLPAGTYTVCGSHSVAAQKMVGSTVSSIVSQTVGSATFTLTEETLVKAVPVIPSGTTVSGETAWVAVYAGSTAYPYVPYGHAGLWARGRNLVGDLAAIKARNTAGTWSGGTYTLNGVSLAFNEDGSIVANGTSTGVSFIQLAQTDFLLQAGTYQLSGCPAGGGTTTYRLDVERVGASVFATDNGSGATFTLDTDTNINVRLRVPSGAALANKVFRPMLRLASTGAEFVPYASTVTPVPLDGHELRSLPDGTRDEVTVDEYGHAVLVQRVGHTVLNGSETWAVQNNGARVAMSLSPTAIGPANNAEVPNLLCNHFVAASPNTTWSGTSAGIAIGTNGQGLIVADGTGAMTVAAWTSWLTANPTTVQYALATPVTHDLGYVDAVPLVGPDLTAQTVPSAEFALTALLKTGRSTVMWDGEELSAGWTLVSDRREQLLPTDVATIDVPGLDGALFGGVTRAVRQVTLALHVMGPFGERAPHVRELAARLAVDGPRPLMFSDEAPLWRMAVPNADPEGVAFYNADGYADVKFVCPDPWFYGEEAGVTVPSGGSVTFTVGGTAPTMPIVTAPAALNGSGGVWRLMLDDTTYIAASVPSARSLVCDCVDRVLRVNGTVTLLRPDADWLVLEPGTHTLAMTGTGAATVTWTERWY